MSQPFAVIFGGFAIDHSKNFRAKIKSTKTYQIFASGAKVIVQNDIKPFPTFEEFKNSYDITDRMHFLLENKKYQKYMSKQRGKRTPDEKPITMERPKASSITTVNDGYGDTDFKRNLLLIMVMAIIGLGIFVFGFIIGLNVR